MTKAEAHDLHEGFRDPRRVPAGDLKRFLEQADRLHADLVGLELPDASFDAIRTERVLMYLPDDAFEVVVDELIRLLRPGGRLALFELDYGATILAPGSDSDVVVQQVHDALLDSLPQPTGARRLPGLLAAAACMTSPVRRSRSP